MLTASYANLVADRVSGSSDRALASFLRSDMVHSFSITVPTSSPASARDSSPRRKPLTI
jgi:hypothetical protein